MSTTAKEAPKTAPAVKAKSLGTRSPNYPQLNFAGALDRIKKIHEKERTHSVPDQSLAAALGYATLNGTSRAVLSAIKKYGLLVASGTGFKVSPDAVMILFAPVDDSRRGEAIRRCALRPAIFKDLFNKYGLDLPSDQTITFYLTEREFEREAAQQVLRYYKETLAYLSKEAPYGVPPNDSEDASSNVDSVAPQPSDASRTEASDKVIGIRNLNVATPSAPGDHLKFRIAADCSVELIFSGPVSQESIDQLKIMLDAQKLVFPSVAATASKEISSIQDSDDEDDYYDDDDEANLFEED